MWIVRVHEEQIEYKLLFSYHEDRLLLLWTSERDAINELAGPLRAKDCYQTSDPSFTFPQTEVDYKAV